MTKRPTNAPDTGLARFLRDPSNSVSREVMLAHRVSFELKLASARLGFDLRVYRPDVDRDGFDLLIEQRSIARVIQLKSVMRGSSTRTWRVRTHLLHPSRNRSQRLGFTMPKLGLGDGLDGCVLLCDFEVVSGYLQVQYRLFDLAVAAAHASGQTGVSNKVQEESHNLIKAMRGVRGDGTVPLPARLFLNVPSAEGVLALLGLRTRYFDSWAYHALWAFRLWEHPAADGDGKTLDEHMTAARQDLYRITSGPPKDPNVDVPAVRLT